VNCSKPDLQVRRRRAHAGMVGEVRKVLPGRGCPASSTCRAPCGQGSAVPTPRFSGELTGMATTARLPLHTLPGWKAGQVPDRYHYWKLCAEQGIVHFLAQQPAG